MYVTITIRLGDVALLVDEWQRHHNLLEGKGEMYSRAAISKQANIVNSNSLTFARALSSGNNEINNATLVDYNHVPRQYWLARFWLATVESRN